MVPSPPKARPCLFWSMHGQSWPLSWVNLHAWSPDHIIGSTQQAYHPLAHTTLASSFCPCRLDFLCQARPILIHDWLGINVQTLLYLLFFFFFIFAPYKCTYRMLDGGPTESFEGVRGEEVAIRRFRGGCCGAWHTVHACLRTPRLFAARHAPLALFAPMPSIYTQCMYAQGLD